VSSISKPWRLLRRVVPQRTERSLPDPADMGTAFGLDYCLGQAEPGDVTGLDPMDLPDPFQHGTDRMFSRR